MSDTPEESEESKDAPEETNDKDETNNVEAQAIDSSPSLNMTLFLYWVLPVLILSIVSRFGVSPRPPLPKSAPPRPISLDLNKQQNKMAEKVKQRNKKKQPSASPTAALSKMPTSYQKVVKEIEKRRPRWNAGLETTTTASTAPKATKKKEPSESDDSALSDVRISSDPQRQRMEEIINKYRKAYEVSKPWE